MKASDLRKKTVDDLHEELNSLLKLLFSLRLKRAVAASSGGIRSRDVRRDIARVKFVLSEKGVSV